ncbi:AAA family ATPase [Pandoraea sp. NPDC087047]|uniref:AAA family ATPase n=1 Tax=Pandoraea sp. NPDC087047 TaxID=3364390 RepID=UPI0038093313
MSSCKTHFAEEITVEHWLLKLVEAGNGDIPAILHHYRVDVDSLCDVLMSTVDRLPRNLRKEPALSSQFATVLDACADKAQWPIRSGNLLQVIVEAPHLLRAPSLWPFLNFTSAQIDQLLLRLGTRTCETPLRHNGVSSTVDGQTESMPETGFPQDLVQPHTPLTGDEADSASTADPLAHYTIDLTQRARNGELDPVFGRDQEIQQIVEVLAKRRKNNPVLVGEPGVGKTTLVDGLALRVANGNVPNVIRDARILTLNLELLQADAEGDTQCEHRFNAVIEALQTSAAPVLLFIDEPNTLVESDRPADGLHVANLLKRTLAHHELRTIAAITWAEYKTVFEHDVLLTRHFQIIQVDEPNDDDAFLMLRGLKWHYATFHRVHVRDEALVAAVKLSRRYVPSRKLPDKAFDLIDTAAGRVRMALDIAPAALQHAAAAVSALEIEQATLAFDIAEGGVSAPKRLKAIETSLHAARADANDMRVRCATERKLVNVIRAQRDAAPHERDACALALAFKALTKAQDANPLVPVDVDARVVAQVVSDWTGVPVSHLVTDERRNLLALDEPLSSRVLGQQDTLLALAEHLRTSEAGFKSEHAPLGVFLLTGPSGVGKTETALALADLLFGAGAALTTLHMAEYREANAVSRLLGPLPGYADSGSDGVLTEAVRRRPYGVILLDKVEAAHREVLDLLCQVFDGRMTRDAHGHEIDVRNCVFLMTSHLGAATIGATVAKQTDVTHDVLLDAIRQELLAYFRPALLARVQILAYRPLNAQALKDVVRMKLAKVTERLTRKHGVTFQVSESLVTMMAERCLSLNAGAHGVDADINQRILPTVSRELLARLVSGELPQRIDLTLSQAGQLGVEVVGAGSPRQG